MPEETNTENDSEDYVAHFEQFVYLVPEVRERAYDQKGESEHQDSSRKLTSGQIESNGSIVLIRPTSRCSSRNRVASSVNPPSRTGAIKCGTYGVYKHNF